MKTVRLALDTLWQQPARSPADGCCPTPQLGVSLAEEAPPFQARPCLFVHGSLDLRETRVKPAVSGWQQVLGLSMSRSSHSKIHSMNRTLQLEQRFCAGLLWQDSMPSGSWPNVLFALHAGATKVHMPMHVICLAPDCSGTTP